GGAVDARRHAGGRLFGGEAGAYWEAAADALGDGHDVRLDRRPLIGEQLAGAADAGLHLVENEQEAMAVGQRAQLFEERRGEGADATLALHRLEQDRGRLRPDRGLDRLDVAERHLVEAIDLRPEAVEIFLLAAGGDGRQRAAMERALEGDGAEPLGPTVDIMIAARGLDRAFERLGTGIGEEDAVGEAGLGQTRAQPRLPRNLVEVEDVPQLAGLLGQR